MALHLQTTPPEDRLRVREGAVAPYLRAVRAHILLFALIVLAALVGGIAYLSQRSPLYEATAQLLITPLPQDETDFRGLSLLRDSGDPARTAQTAAALIDTQASAALTAERLGEDYTAKKVLDRTDVKPLGDSDVLAVTARADDPDEAARIANQFTTSALDRAPPRAAHRGRGRNRAGKRAAGRPREGGPPWPSSLRAGLPS